MWRMNENGLLELLPHSSNQTGNLIQISANSQNDLPVEAFVEENEIGSISTQESGTSDEIGSNVHNSEESSARQVPAIVHYIRLEDGSEMKFSQMLFQSGKQLLTDKIINLSEGRAQEKYNTSAHLEYLNTMFPLTRRYSPPVVSRRIISYMNQCKTRVKDQGKTGQGMRDEANFNQGYSQEEELVFLLRDTNKSCDEVSAARVHYGANTRYTGICNPWIAHVQARYYSGYIRKTANKIVVAVCPQGLFVWVSGWSEGRRHDMAVANRHNMYPKLRGLTQYPNFQGLAYADSAFREENPVHTPYNPSDTARKRQFNKKMASVRITAEWAFQIVRSLWPSVKYVPRQKILQGRHGNLPGKNLYNSFFLTNLHSCYARTNLIGTYFDATLPTLEEYLGVPANSLD